MRFLLLFRSFSSVIHRFGRKVGQEPGWEDGIYTLFTVSRVMKVRNRA